MISLLSYFMPDKTFILQAQVIVSHPHRESVESKISMNDKITTERSKNVLKRNLRSPG